MNIHFHCNESFVVGVVAVFEISPTVQDLMNRMEQIVKNIAKVEVEKELSGEPILQSDLYIRTYFQYIKHGR